MSRKIMRLLKVKNCQIWESNNCIKIALKSADSVQNRLVRSSPRLTHVRQYLPRTYARFFHFQTKKSWFFRFSDSVFYFIQNRSKSDLSETERLNCFYRTISPPFVSIILTNPLLTGLNKHAYQTLLLEFNWRLLARDYVRE